jgi:hypothetical protein
MGNLYDIDVIAWAEQQAELLRSGRFSELDVSNLVEEIEDVGKREKRELRSRLAVLIAHLLKWQLQPDRRGRSWSATIANQRKQIADLLLETPSLRRLLDNEAFLERTWTEAQGIAIEQTGLPNVPGTPIWSVSDILDSSFLP